MNNGRLGLKYKILTSTRATPLPLDLSLVVHTSRFCLPSLQSRMRPFPEAETADHATHWRKHACIRRHVSAWGVDPPLTPLGPSYP